MQHVFEYIIDHQIGDNEYGEGIIRVHEYYITESSRMNKVAKKILLDRKISINAVENFQLRKIR